MIFFFLLLFYLFIFGDKDGVNAVFSVILILSWERQKNMQSMPLRFMKMAKAANTHHLGAKA